MRQDTDNRDGNDPQPRHAAEWGLASLLLGGFLAVLALLTLQLCLSLFVSPPIWAPQDLHMLHDAGVAGAFVLGGLCLLSTIFGIRSLASAYRRGQPCALGWAGLLVSILALLLWAGAIADLLWVAEFLTRRLPRINL